MSVAVDHAERLRALDPTASWIVQAPAGSGKTELLTRRILTLLATVEAPEEVLAITFTKKAAAEMRERVLETLVRAAAGESGEDDHAEQGLVLARAVLARDAERGWGLLEDPKRLNLRTIDALTRSLVGGLPVVSTFGGPGDIEPDAAPMYREAARRFVMERIDELSPLLLHLDNDLERLQRLLVTLLGIREQWLRYLSLGDMEDAELRDLLESMIGALVRSRLATLEAALTFDMRHRLARLLPSAARYIGLAHAAAGTEPSDAQRGIVELGQSIGQFPGTSEDDRERWATLASVLLTTTDAPRRSVTVKEGFPGQANAAKLGVTKAELVAHGADMKALLAEVAGTPALIEALAFARSLPEPRYADEDWERLSLIVSRLPALVTELQIVFGEAGRTDYTEVSRRAVIALGTEREPTDLALSMDLRLRHILVDEFQDTSRAQIALLERLVAGWAPDDGRTLFCVGDPMQSIYRFREGDVSLFLRAVRHGIGDVALGKLRLRANFRSSPAVVDWVNERFGPLFPVEPDLDLGAVPYERSEPARTVPGGVHLHVSERFDVRAAAEAVAALTGEALAEDDTGDVGILVRTKRQSVPILQALRARGIAYRAVELDALGERPVVRDLISLALALRHPHDRLHWLAVLRGPLCGLTLSDLHALAGDEPHVAIVERFGDPATVAALSEDGRARVARLLEVVPDAIRRAPRESLVPWVEAIWLRLGGPAACESDADEAAAERCLSKLMELEASGRIWERRSVMEAVSNLFASDRSEAGTRVHVMTLHKSKGLEFDHVIVPGMQHKGRGDDKRLFESLEGTIGQGQGLLLAPIDPPDADRDEVGALAKLIRGTRDRAEVHEVLRLLYVACTRARRTLHLAAALGEPSDKGAYRKAPAKSLLAPLQALFEAHLDTIGAGSEVFGADDDMGPEAHESVELPEVADRPDEPPPFVRPVAGWTPPSFERFDWRVEPLRPPSVPTVEHEWRSDVARQVGTVVHRALQGLAATPVARRGEPDEAARQRYLRELRTLGTVGALLEEAADQVIKAVRNTLVDERGRWLLDEAHAEARSEWALTVPETDAGGRFLGVRRVIVDRTFVDDDGTRWIIDYKTGAHEGGDPEEYLDVQVERYRAQLDAYADILARIDDRPVRLGLWFPMIRGWRELEPGGADALDAASPERAAVV